jgi:hypothetical protein
LFLCQVINVIEGIRYAMVDGIKPNSELCKLRFNDQPASHTYHVFDK